jgi:hypothetical protein
VSRKVENNSILSLLNMSVSSFLDPTHLVSRTGYFDNFLARNAFVKLFLECTTKLFLFGILLEWDSGRAESES